jgi:hypothetical protein
VDPALIKALVRARRWFEALASGQSLEEIAKAEGVSAPYIGTLIPLAFLAPEIVSQIFAGTQPIELTTAALLTRIDLPLAWSEQMAALGYE